jgi:hypothetical protein
MVERALIRHQSMQTGKPLVLKGRVDEPPVSDVPKVTPGETNPLV